MEKISDNGGNVLNSYFEECYIRFINEITNGNASYDQFDIKRFESCNNYEIAEYLEDEIDNWLKNVEDEAENDNWGDDDWEYVNDTEKELRRLIDEMINNYIEF